MKLQDYLRVLRKRWRWLAVSMVIGVLAAVGITLATPPLYQATSQIFVAPGAVSTTSELAQGSTFAQNRVKSYVQVISSDLVLDPVVRELNLTMTPAELAKKVTATVPTDTVLIDITVTDPSPAQAATIADAIAQEFPGVAKSIEPRRADDAPAVTVTVTQQAAVPTSPVSPRLELNVGLGLLVGALLGLALMALRETFDTRLKSERDVVAVTTLPVMGRIPFDSQASTRPLVVLADPSGPLAEAYRQLRTNLQFVAAGSKGRAVLLTSSVPSEGKSSTAVNLAISLAEAGSRVCLVDADLRRPGLDRYLDLEGAVGLTTVLIGGVTLSDAVQPLGDGNLRILMTGQRPPNPSELLSSQAMAEVLAELENRYDIVIIDGPPLLPVTDSAVLARRCTAVLVVVGTGAVHRRELQRSLTDLESVGAPVIGVVLTKLARKGPDAAGMKTYSYTTDATSVGPAPSAKAPEVRSAGSTAERRLRKGEPTGTPDAATGSAASGLPIDPLTPRV